MAAVNEHRSQCLLRVPDVQGSYTIPHIQTAPEIVFTVPFEDSAYRRARAVLTARGSDVIATCLVTRDQSEARFAELAAGTYAIRIDYLDDIGNSVTSAMWHGIGVGTILAALGNSLTEGYHGHGFRRENLDLSAADFPADAVSLDGRNFPQFAPTTAVHKPEVNCFQSWMTRLNDGLTEAWQQPVFIANEGWGGYTSGQYLEMMRGNHGGWRDRMELLRPNVWLIHLGVNDERHQVSPESFAANMEEMIQLLMTNFKATPETIFVARPSYDYAPDAEAILSRYIARIDLLVAELGLQSGPDFFAAFARDKDKWYGADPVHPNPEGMDYMADLWLDALLDYRVDSALSVPLPTKTSPAPVPSRPRCLIQNLREGRHQTIVAHEQRLPLIDHYPAWLNIRATDRTEFDRLVPDGAHPNAPGCRRVVAPAILRALDLGPTSCSGNPVYEGGTYD